MGCTCPVDEEQHERTFVHEDVEVDVGTAFDADEDLDVYVDAHAKEHAGKATKMDADQWKMGMWIEAWM